MSTAEENEHLRRFRLDLATLLILIGLITASAGTFGVINGQENIGLLLPVFALFTLSGAAGIGVHAATDLSLSRLFSLWSAMLAGAGVLAAFAISRFMV
ncbi:hypothetical protein [Actinoplanes sp. TFC3]|uniref:hypothetical protein n=1 Tax=Actinoplanes sp. TFC3 TaxID=1710355 RepID=UPI00129081E5|nr:hypothetical protein [Actinoplanes sp. TFC3]